MMFWTEKRKNAGAGAVIMALCILVSLVACGAETPVTLGELQSFRYEKADAYGAMMERGTVCQVTIVDSGALVECYDESSEIDIICVVDSTFLTGLDELITSLGLQEWDGFSGDDLTALDGSSWSLDIAYSDGEIHAGGINAYPDDFDKLDEILTYIHAAADEGVPC